MVISEMPLLHQILMITISADFQVMPVFLVGNFKLTKLGFSEVSSSAAQMTLTTLQLSLVPHLRWGHELQTLME
jgi:hypothetical protein